MPRQRRFTARQLSDLRKLRARGSTYAELARRFDAPEATVRDVLIRGYRILPKPKLPRRNPIGRPRRFSAEDVALIQRRRAEGYRYAEIATELDAPVTTVQRAARDYPRDPRYELKTCPTCHKALVAPDGGSVPTTALTPREERLVALLCEQWEYNHAEHCGGVLPHDGHERCYWPRPAELVTAANGASQPRP